MINTFESVKVLKVGKVESLDTDFAPSSTSKKAFHIFIRPLEGADNDAGEIICINAKPAKNDDFVEVPIVLGDWNPVLFEKIAANANTDTDIDLDKYAVYYSEIDNY